MLRGKSLWLSALSLLVISVGAYLMSQQRLSPEQVDELLNRHPSFKAEDFAGQSFNAQGRLQNSFTASSMRYYKKSDLLTTIKPEAFYYDYKNNETAPEIWHLSADEGYFYLNRGADLKGQVRAVPLFASAAIKQIETDSLHYDLSSNSLSSPDLITIKGKDFINYGRNYQINLDTRTFTILGAPHAIYTPAVSTADHHNSEPKP